jgi:hypothetical protein
MTHAPHRTAPYRTVPHRTVSRRTASPSEEQDDSAAQ